MVRNQDLKFNRPLFDWVVVAQLFVVADGFLHSLKFQRRSNPMASDGSKTINMDTIPNVRYPKALADR